MKSATTMPYQGNDAKDAAIVRQDRSRRDFHRQICHPGLVAGWIHADMRREAHNSCLECPRQNSNSPSPPPHTPLAGQHQTDDRPRWVPDPRPTDTIHHRRRWWRLRPPPHNQRSTFWKLVLTLPACHRRDHPPRHLWRRGPPPPGLKPTAAAAGEEPRSGLGSARVGAPGVALGSDTRGALYVVSYTMGQLLRNSDDENIPYRDSNICSS
jgi:hypothetical protein